MRKIFTILIGLMVFNLAFSQDGHYTQISQNPLYLNPAMIGSGSQAIRLGGIYRSQWSAVQAPYTNYGIFADAKIKNFSAGFLVNQNNAGSTGYKKSNVVFALGYRKPLGDGYNSLSIGAQLGMNQIAIDPNLLFFDSQYNPEIGLDETLVSGEDFTNTTMKARDVNIGVAYNFDLDRSVPVKGEVGLAIYHVNNPKMNTMLGETMNFPRKVVLHGRAYFALNESFGVEPMAMYAGQGSARELVGGIGFGFNMSDTSGFKLGIGNRFKDAILFTAQFNMRKMTIALGFDYNISGLRQANSFNNAMELSMIYNLPVKIEEREPKDTDGDGILDRKDKCPEVPGVQRLQGCPEELGSAQKETIVPVLGLDYDKDGILDHNDLCPYEFGYAQYQGCNDQDADGIWDHIDVCPALPGKVENQGCPVEIPGIDSDRDGIPDRFDKCIYIKGVEEFNGCPDTDDDGISDLMDDCPYVKGTREGNGCPVNKMSNTGFSRGEELSIDVVEFDTDKYKIKSEYHFMLNRLAEMLANESNYKLIIEGHTDDEGSSTHNIQLSQRRSNAVRNYLIERGAPPHMIEIYYFGENKPKSNNTSAYGKARNRRSELILFETN